MADMTLSDISEEMRDIDFCMLTTRTESGGLAGRPMSNNRDVDYDGDSWFFAYDSARSIAEIERDPVRAVQGADLVFADTWVSMHDPQSAKERRHNMLRGYQVNEELMSHAKPDALFMHCLPAHRDDEVTSAVMDGPNSVIFDEAENRLHAQKAVMRWCLGV